MLKSDIRDRAIPWANLILETGEMPDDLNLGYKSRFSAAIVMLLAVLLVLLPVFTRLGKVPLQWTVLAVIAGILLLIGLNQTLYRFFCKQHGFVFMLAAISIHWLYYFYSGVVWMGCSASHFLGKAFGAGPIQTSSPVSDTRRSEVPSRRAPESVLDHVGTPDPSNPGTNHSPGNVVIIGAGPAGLTAAYELSKHGRPAVVLESDDIVGGLPALSITKAIYSTSAGVDSSANGKR